MKGEKKLVPKRRYQGFIEKWDKNKLENIASFSKGRGYSKKDLTDIGHQLILYGRLYTNYETVIQSVDTYTIKQEKSMLSKGGEVIVPSSGETKEDIARASAILAPNIIIGGDLNVVIPSKELDSIFLALNISNGSCQRELMKRAQGSSVVHLYNEDLISVTLHFPSLEEQQKIGEFFKVLDERITNQERKTAKVKALKAAYLTEMFPQEGETVPKRRFKGFEGEWKSEKLDNIAEYRRGSFPQPYGEEKWYDDVNGMPFVQVVDVAKNLRLVNNTKQKISKLAQPSSVYVDKGKVLVTLQGSIGRVAITQYPSYVDRTLLIFDDYKYQVDIYYFAYIIQLLFDIEKQKAPGGTIKTITKEALSEFIVKLPSYDEQQKIGAFFKNLDNQIEMEEEKLDKLKKMKEAYLEEMFV